MNILMKKVNYINLLIILAFIVFSLNIRGALNSLPPIIEDIKKNFGISDGIAGFLSSIPVICFGLFTPLAGLLMKKIKTDTALFIVLSGVLVGTLMRSAGGIECLFVGTLIIGLSLTLGNIVGLMLIGQEFSANITTMTGIFVCFSCIGAMAVMGLTAPLQAVIGWQFALLAPALPAALAILLWIAALYLKSKTYSDSSKVEENIIISETQILPEAEVYSIFKDPLVILLAVSFAAHSFMFYGIFPWLPAMLVQNLGISASKAAFADSVLQFAGLLGSFGIPMLNKKFSDRVQFMSVCAAWIITVLGLWLKPEFWGAWVLLGGFSSGGGFTIVFSIIMRYARNRDENRAISTTVQTVGYFVAAVGPFIVGHLHQISGDWSSGMIVLSISSLVMTVCGFLATRSTNSSVRSQIGRKRSSAV